MVRDTRSQPLPAALTPQTNLDDVLRDVFHAAATHWLRIVAALSVSLAAVVAAELLAGHVAGRVAVITLGPLAGPLAWAVLPRDSATISRSKARRTVFAISALLLAAATLPLVAPRLDWVGWFITIWIVDFLAGAIARPYVFGSTPRNHRLGTRAS